MRTTQPPIVQIYDYSRVREYIKVREGIIFSSERIIKTESLEESLILSIQSEATPNKVVINGERYLLIKEKSGE